MAKRAFLVASQVLGLEGPIGDAERMAGALAKRGFTIELCVGRDATRAGILDGYLRLLRDTSAHDAALFYYSGHGALAVASGEAPGDTRMFQCIVPVDIQESADGDFRGIAAQELSELLRKLTEKSSNATVILDCCHAACMSRGLDARPKALPRSLIAGVALHVERLSAAGLRLDRLDPEGNSHAVRLVAAGLHQSAYEYVGTHGVPEGVMTEALLLTLAEIDGHEVTWEAVGQRVRERVLARFPMQRPEVEGPAGRVLFEERVRLDRSGVLAVTIAEGRVLLHGGRIHGLHPGDEYAIVPMTATELDASPPSGVARVLEVRAAESVASVELAPGYSAIPAGARARPLRSAAPVRPIQVEAEQAARDVIARALVAEPRFRVETAAPGIGSEPTLAIVRVAGAELTLLDGAGVPLLPAAPYSEPAVADLVANLQRLLAAHSLRELTAHTTESLRDTQLEVEWGRVEDGHHTPCAQNGAFLAVGTRVYVRVRNTRPTRPLYVSLFDVGVAQKITLLTQSEPSGVVLDEHRPEYVLGARDGVLRGLPLSWSSALPEDEVRAESIVVIATEAPRDLRALETAGLAHTRGTKGIESPLQQLVRQVQHGGTRDLSRDDEEDEGYLVRRIDFQLSPWPTASTSGDFLIDQRPAASLQVFTPRALVKPPRAVAIRITDLVIADTRALFGDADIRVDTLVITRLSGQAAEPYRVETMRFRDVRDGERLPIGKGLVYHGSVRDFVDIRVWVSRDRVEAKTLSELFAERLNSPELKTAAGALLATTAIAPQAAAIVAATGAAATLGKIAWELLAQALPKSIGLYQTSLLANERFGVGRNPPRGSYKAQRFSFAFEVDDVR